MFSSCLTLILFLVSVIFAHEASKGADGCGCGAIPVIPRRNPYVCTPDQLRKAAIAMTNQIESYMSPINMNALFNFVPPYTNLTENVYVFHTGGNYCCQQYEDLYTFIAFLSHANAEIVFINQIPMSAVISEVECTVRVFATMMIYSQETLQIVGSGQIAFVWKPVYPGHVVPDCTCNLELLRIEARNPLCNFNEAPCGGL